MTTVNPHSKISLHYSLSLEDGTEIENNFDQQALVCFIGDGTLTSGMEDALIGLKIEDSIEITIQPEQGYGFPSEENVHSLPSSDFDRDMKIEIGQVIAFDGPDEDEEIVGTVTDIKNKEVIVDFSHPLAGRTLIFKATVMAIENEQES